MEPPPSFLDLLAGRPSGMPLDQAALELAALDHQPVDRRGALLLLDEWAASLAEVISPTSPGPQFLSALNDLFFGRLGFAGDNDDYHNPLNSCLDTVLTRRRGLPITLSVAYMELARRLDHHVEGLALPAHFLCRYTDDSLPVYIDVFHGGRLMTEEDCVELISSALGQPLELDPAAFPAAPPRVILHRMINNLRNAYSRAGRVSELEKLTLLQQQTLQRNQH